MSLQNNLLFEIQNGIIVVNTLAVPPSLTNIQIYNSFSNITIEWDPTTITGVIITYTINCTQGGLGTKNTTSNSITFPGAISGTTYSFTITPSIGSINGSTISTPNITPSFSLATGGDSITTANINGIPHKFHKFTSTTSSTFTVNLDINAYILVVGSGGGGGSQSAAYAEGCGGGGGGEVFYTSNSSNAGTVLLKTGTTCTITVGATTNKDTNGNSTTCTIKNSSNSLLIDIIAKGGCFGGGSSSLGIPGTGNGSGGGGCGINRGSNTNNMNGSNATITTYSPVDETFFGKYTNLAKNGGVGNHLEPGGGGGGASSNGLGFTTTYFTTSPNSGYYKTGGNGGAAFVWIDGNSYGGGGGGGTNNYRGFYGGSGAINAGNGGAYDGYKYNPSTGYYASVDGSIQASSGLDNYGGGGGGGYGLAGTLDISYPNSGSGGSGGSGVVIIAYPV